MNSGKTEGISFAGHAAKTSDGQHATGHNIGYAATAGATTAAAATARSTARSRATTGSRSDDVWEQTEQDHTAQQASWTRPGHYSHREGEQVSFLGRPPLVSKNQLLLNTAVFFAVFPGGQQGGFVIGSSDVAVLLDFYAPSGTYVTHDRGSFEQCNGDEAEEDFCVRSLWLDAVFVTLW